MSAPARVLSGPDFQVGRWFGPIRAGLLPFPLVAGVVSSSRSGCSRSAPVLA